MPTALTPIAFGEFPQGHQTITLGAGEILPNGRDLIALHTQNTLRAMGIDAEHYQIFTGENAGESWRWEAKILGKARFVGSIAKRISLWVHTRYGVKLPADIVSTIGNIAAEFTLSGETIHFDFTKRINWRAGEFGDDGSCYWGCRSAAREALEDNDFAAIRIYQDHEFYQGVGRAWILPADNAYAVFNAYGPHCHNKLGQLIAQLWGATYKRVELSNNDDTTGTLWINSGRGTLVYRVDDSESAALSSCDFSIDCDDYGSPCANCGESITDGESYHTCDGDMCESCYCDNYSSCEACGESYSHEDITYLECVESYYCDHCRDNRFTRCSDCGEYCRDSESRELPNGDSVCPDCVEACYCDCDHCGELSPPDETSYCESNGESYCTDCLDNSSEAPAHTCDHCGELQGVDDLTAFSPDHYCGALAGAIVCPDCVDAPNQVMIDWQALAVARLEPWLAYAGV